VYAPQVGTVVEKEECLMYLREVVPAVGADEYVMVCGDMNGHVGDRVDGFGGSHPTCASIEKQTLNRR